MESTLDGQNVPVWTAVTTQGHGVVSVSGEEARGVHEKCGELHTIPAILAPVPREVSVRVVEVAVFPQHHYLDGGSIPSRGADEIPLF